MKISGFLRQLVLFGAIFLFCGSSAAAQVEKKGITECDIQSFIGQHPAYDDCGPLLAQAQACLDTVLIGSEVQAQVYNFLRGKGLSAIQAVAIMGNMQTESAGTWDPRVVQGDPPTFADAPTPGVGYGLAQWTFPSRQEGLVKYAAEVGGSPGDLSVQLGYLYKESNERGNWQGLLKETDIRSATWYWEDNFEAPDVKHQEARVQHAIGFLTEFGSGSGSGALITSGCSGSTVPGPSGACPADGIVYRDQYTESQLRQLFGPPVRETHANLVSVDFLGSSVLVSKVVAPCLEAVAQELLANGVTYRPEAAKGGIFCIRDFDGQVGDRSYHIYGAACDINPQTNNYFGDGQARPYDPNCPIATSVVESGHCFDMPQEYVSAFEHHGFTWGGNWNSSKDYMHFEWHGASP